MIGAIWGGFIWKEFKGRSARIYFTLGNVAQPGPGSPPSFKCYLRFDPRDLGRLEEQRRRDARNRCGRHPVRLFYAGYRLLAADDKAGADFRECKPGEQCDWR